MAVKTADEAMPATIAAQGELRRNSLARALIRLPSQ
jgi:hypothetical protein